MPARLFPVVVFLSMISTAFAVPISPVLSLPHKCMAVTDYMLHKAGMGSFNHPSACNLKTATWNVAGEPTYDMSEFKNGRVSVFVIYDKIDKSWEVKSCAWLTGFHTAACTFVKLDPSCSVTNLATGVPTIDDQATLVYASSKTCRRIVGKLRTNSEDFPTGDIKTGLCVEFRDFISE